MNLLYLFHRRLFQKFFPLYKEIILCYFSEKYYINLLKFIIFPGCGGRSLSSWDSRDRGRQIYEVETNLIWDSCRTGIVRFRQQCSQKSMKGNKELMYLFLLTKYSDWGQFSTKTCLKHAIIIFQVQMKEN